MRGPRALYDARMSDGRGFDEFDSGDERQIDVKRWLVALRRRRHLIAALVLFGLPIAVLVPWLQKPVYVASVKLAIQLSPEVMDVGADFMPRGVGRANPLARAEAIVLSDRVLGGVVANLGTPREAEAPANGVYARARALARQGLVRLGLRDPVPAAPDAARIRQAQIDALRAAIRIEADSAGSILEVSASSPAAGQAAWLANEIAEVFVAHEAEERREASQTALRWLSQKTAELRDTVRRKEEQRDALASQLGRSSRDTTQRADTRAKMLADLEAARLELLATEQRLAELRPQVERALPIQDVQRRELRGQYEASRNALESARLRFTETHPEVRRLRSLVEGLEAQLAGLATVESDPLRQDRILEFRRLEGERGQLQARVSAVRGALSELGGIEEPDRGLLERFERLDREVAIDREMLSLLMKRQNETILHAASASPLARILDVAVPPLHPEPLRRLLLLGVGVAAVLGLAIGAAVVMELLDPAIYEADSVADVLDVPLLQQIPLASDESAPELQSQPESQSLLAEAFRSLRTSLLFASGSRPLRSLLVTSSVAGEGKTTCSINLASAFAQTGPRVLVMDADLRRPRQHKVLGVDRGPGLAEALAGEVEVDDVIRRPRNVLFDVIPAGQPVANPADLLGSQAFRDALALLEKRYDLVIVDAPVLLAVADALVLSSRVDGVLFVSKPGAVDRAALRRVQQDLERSQANVLGVAVTHVDPRDPYVYPAYLYSPYTSGEAPPRRSRLAALLGP